MTTLTEGPRTGEFIVSEASGQRSREQIIIDNGANLVPGEVIAAVETGTATIVAGAAVSGSGGTVGNGSIGTPTADEGAMAGIWLVKITSEAANLGNFVVERPDGTIDGVGIVGTAYNGQINFTLADDTNDWKEDDFIPVTVSYPTSVRKWKRLDTAATNGAQIAAGILYAEALAASVEVDGVAIVRDAEVNLDLLTWPSGISAANKAAAILNLSKAGIIVR